MKTIAKLWILIIILIIITPIGLIIPAHFKACTPWGEWGADEIEKLAGYIPRGLAKLSSLWSAPMPEYAFKDWDRRPLCDLSFAYVISAAAGILAAAGIIYLIGKFLTRKD